MQHTFIFGPVSNIEHCILWIRDTHNALTKRFLNTLYTQLECKRKAKLITLQIKLDRQMK